MSKSMLTEYRTMGRIAQQTRHLLLQCQQEQILTGQQMDQLEGTLRHLAAVREGFQLSLRSGGGNLHELRDIVRYTLDVIDWSFLEELNLMLVQADRIERLGPQLTAFAHATVALALLPMVPPSQVTHPTSSHYRDLHSPRRAGEWLERIEELETVLTRLKLNNPARLSSPALRRTHAFFDASAWVVRDHLQRFGVD